MSVLSLDYFLSPIEVHIPMEDPVSQPKEES